MKRFSIYALILIASACSDPDPKSNTVNVNNANNGNNASNNGNNANNQNNRNNVDSICPNNLSGACEIDGLTCETGNDPRDECRTSATCNGEIWISSQPDCSALPDLVCPATIGAADGELCSPEEAYCSYGDLDCECTKCDDTGPVQMCDAEATWHCEQPNTDPDCPEGKVNHGTLCDDPGKQCVYACGGNGALECRNGAWQPANGGPCPRSTKRLKTEIHYLNDIELRAVSYDLQALKLARYQYTHPELPLGDQLGIIIEDAPGSFAVNERAKMVDLYGLASMLLADAQEKDRRIEMLEATVKKLESKMEHKTAPE